MWGDEDGLSLADACEYCGCNDMPEKSLHLQPGSIVQLLRVKLAQLYYWNINFEVVLLMSRRYARTQ